MSATMLTSICFTSIVTTSMAVFLLVKNFRFARQNSTISQSPLSQNAQLLQKNLQQVFSKKTPGSLSQQLDLGWDQLMVQSGLEDHSQTIFLTQIFTGLLSGGLIFLYLENPAMSLFAGFIGMLLPLLFVLLHRQKRFKRIFRELPEILDLMTRALRAGESLDQVIRTISKEAEGPLKFEFDRCKNQRDMGLSLTKVMQGLIFRVPLLEMRMLATTLLVQNQTGGNLSESLERMSRVVRDRHNFRRQLRAATGAGRASALLLSTITPALYITMFIWQPDHVQVLVDHPTGQMLLSTAICLELIGIIWVMSLLRNDL